MDSEENTRITAPFTLNTMRVMSQIATKPHRPCPALRPRFLPPFLLSQCNALIDCPAQPSGLASYLHFSLVSAMH